MTAGRSVSGPRELEQQVLATMSRDRVEHDQRSPDHGRFTTGLAGRGDHDICRREAARHVVAVGVRVQASLRRSEALGPSVEPAVQASMVPGDREDLDPSEGEPFGERLARPFGPRAAEQGGGSLGGHAEGVARCGT